MRMLVLLALTACGSPCPNPPRCAVTEASPVAACPCEGRYCKTCVCNTVGCEFGDRSGHLEYIDCETLKIVKRSCAADGYP